MNARVDPFLERLEETTDGPHVTYLTQGALALAPPPEEAPEHQSIGAWKGFLGYAAAAGVIVWVGLYTGTIFLLTAAMLIAPFGGPAMNAALATASGDGRLLRRSVLRYVAALAVSIAVAFALSFALRQEAVTALMV